MNSLLETEDTNVLKRSITGCCCSEDGGFDLNEDHQFVFQQSHRLRKDERTGERHRHDRINLG